MKYSIIITGWNCQTYVKRCLRSVEAQTFNSYEVIIVDDGSTDDTYKEILKHAPHLSQIFRFEKNKGTYYARDFAISKATGTIIVLLDMDDALLPNALEEVDKLYKAGKWMTYGNYQFADGSGTCPLDIEFSFKVHKERSYRQDVWRCTHLRTFKKSLYDYIPKWELTQSEINSYPDVEVLFSLLEMCGKEFIGVIKTPIYIYNTTNDNATLKRFGKDNDGYAEICNRQKRELI